MSRKKQISHDTKKQPGRERQTTEKGEIDKRKGRNQQMKRERTMERGGDSGERLIKKNEGKRCNMASPPLIPYIYVRSGYFFFCCCCCNFCCSSSSFCIASRRAIMLLFFTGFC